MPKPRLPRRSCATALAFWALLCLAGATQANPLAAARQLPAAQTAPSVTNPDGTTTYTIVIEPPADAPGAAAFVPANILIQPGDTITWINLDPAAAHSITFPDASGVFPAPAAMQPADSGSDYDGTSAVSSGSLSPGQAFSLRFTTRGTFLYRDLLQPATYGSIEVEDRIGA